ncbi:hypothetical protein [Coleofasciculus sp.]|uniref:hypothetical protein n=1 Tax=Coleofasciculus sp. TaxID=3100458 RepID=UPI003A42FD01
MLRLYMSPPAPLRSAPLISNLFLDSPGQFSGICGVQLPRAENIIEVYSITSQELESFASSKHAGVNL